jgi:hypothetical protein
MIRKKNRIHRKAKHFNNPMDWNKYRKIRNEVASLARNTGPDFINHRLLKEAAPIIKYPLCKLFNFSLLVASYPCQWRRTNITPVSKNIKQNDVQSYRPISLLSVI